MFLIKKICRLLFILKCSMIFVLNMHFRSCLCFQSFVSKADLGTPPPRWNFFFIAKSNFIVELFNAKETVFAQSRNVGP